MGSAPGAVSQGPTHATPVDPKAPILSTPGLSGANERRFAEALDRRAAPDLGARFQDRPEIRGGAGTLAPAWTGGAPALGWWVAWFASDHHAPPRSTLFGAAWHAGAPIVKFALSVLGAEYRPDVTRAAKA